MQYFISANLFFLRDPLSLFFLSLIALVSLPAVIYSFGYLRGAYPAPRIALCQLLAGLFIFSMALVVTAGNLLFFLIAWEIMSFVSFFLVLFEHEHAKSVRSAVLYLIMTHIGTAFLTAAFILMFHYSHSFDFIAIRDALRFIPASARNILFLFLLIGFGTKAGIVPLHIWLPAAHPQAPSHISSIMSGVMIKIAIYGFIRFVIYIVGVNTLWWGVLVLALAVVSCLTGITYALIERDIKRVLAYSSVENMGIILLGVGASMVFLNEGLNFLAVFSLAAGLYHLINHGIFKGLLFLGAGSVYKACGTRDMEKMGGLIKRMPQSAAFFLIGALAISGMPPLNGFAGEWLTLQAFFSAGAQNLGIGVKLIFAICAAALIFTGALAAACFVRAFGITFLGLPRSHYVQKASEVPFSMRLGMFIPASLTIVFGIFAPYIFSALSVVSGSALSLDTSNMRFAGVHLPVTALALLLLFFCVGGFFIYSYFGRKHLLQYRTWDCGYYKLGARNEYTATAFSKPFRIAFNFFLLPYRKTEKIRETFYHVSSFTYQTHTTQVFRKYLYDPLLAGIINISLRFKKIQSGSIHLYIGYIFITVAALIIFINRF